MMFLDVLQFFVGDGGEMREVEAETGRLDERAGLLDVRAEDFAQRGVEQVRGRVVAARGVAELLVHDAVSTWSPA